MKVMYIKYLPKDAKQIPNSKDYVDMNGNIYGIENRNNKHKGKFFIKAQYTNFGYKYCGINYNNGKHISKRVHRLVAETFLPNPNNYPIVMHKDNNKKNNNVDNLQWGTVSQNTKQAYDDGLLLNDKGFDDSQSIPCTCYDTLTNKLIGHYGSISIASESLGITKTGILHHINNPNAPIRKKCYCVKFKENPIPHDVIGRFDFNTDEEIDRFVNIGIASKETNISDSVISSQIAKGKPKWTKNEFYFKKILVK